MWYVYLLRNSKTGRTYIGCTTDPKRRLRQHNGEIGGGAWSTRRGAPHWELDLVLEGFESRSIACRWEAILKKRARGIEGRRSAFMMVVEGTCPPSTRGGKTYKVPGQIKVGVYTT